jgi:hypothetical protein
MLHVPDGSVIVCFFLADVRLVVNLPVSLARQIHYYLVDSQLTVLQERHKELEQMMQEGMYISTFDSLTAVTEDSLSRTCYVVFW